MSEDRVLRLERVFSATPDKVYAAWTTPDTLAKWWGPEGTTMASHSFDASEGGNYRATMRVPDGSEHTVTGVFRELVPNRRVVLTWAWEQEGKRGHETEIRVDLEPKGDGTLMRFEQSVFADTDQRDKHNQGWTSTFNRLDTIVN